MVALGALAGLIPRAMVGVLGLGVVMAELALVLAAIGGLAEIPGLRWLINEGGQFLHSLLAEPLAVLSAVLLADYRRRFQCVSSIETGLGAVYGQCTALCEMAPAGLILRFWRASRLWPALS